jgi:outer membrane protein assembly factor BamD (BamD/ComL family)
MQGRAAETSSSEARMAAAPSEEAALVLSALRALRRGHDPVQAGALLDQYLARFSRGVLGEEALALGMEAALDRNDTTAAARLADQYMRRYPAGRFTDLARRAMGSKGP